MRNLGFPFLLSTNKAWAATCVRAGGGGAGDPDGQCLTLAGLFTVSAAGSSFSWCRAAPPLRGRGALWTTRPGNAFGVLGGSNAVSCSPLITAHRDLGRVSGPHRTSVPSSINSVNKVPIAGLRRKIGWDVTHLKWAAQWGCAVLTTRSPVSVPALFLGLSDVNIELGQETAH